MMSYNQILSKYQSSLIKVEPIVRYRAYKDGEVREFDTKYDASSFSNLIETYISNIKEWEAYEKAFKESTLKAKQKWISELKKKFSHYNEKAFDAIYLYTENYLRNYENDESYYDRFELEFAKIDDLIRECSFGDYC